MQDRAAQTLSMGLHGGEGSVAGGGSQQQQQLGKGSAAGGGTAAAAARPMQSAVRVQRAGGWHSAATASRVLQSFLADAHDQQVPPHFSSGLPTAHCTCDSCAPERNWSMFGSIFSKTKNQLALERAKSTAHIRGNSSGSNGAHREILLSDIDVVDEKEQCTAKILKRSV